MGLAGGAATHNRRPGPLAAHGRVGAPVLGWPGDVEVDAHWLGWPRMTKAF